MAEKPTADFILRLPEVRERIQLSSSQIYHLASKGEFPKPIKLGARASGWLESEIDTWLIERIRKSRVDEEAGL